MLKGSLFVAGRPFVACMGTFLDSIDANVSLDERLQLCVCRKAELQAQILRVREEEKLLLRQTTHMIVNPGVYFCFLRCIEEWADF